MKLILTIDNIDRYEVDIALAKKGDKEAFSRLIGSNKASLYRVALSLLAEKQDIEDAIKNMIELKSKVESGTLYLCKFIQLIYNRINS